MTVASATPGANRVPKALGTGKLAAGWMTADAMLADLGLGAGAAGDLVYGSGANALSRLPVAPAGQLLVSGASAPAWSGTGLTWASNILTATAYAGTGGTSPGAQGATAWAGAAGVIRSGTQIRCDGTSATSIQTAGGMEAAGNIATTGNGKVIRAFDATNLRAVDLVADSGGRFAWGTCANIGAAMVEQWTLYPAGTSNLYMRDQANARMHVLWAAGTATTAQTSIYSTVLMQGGTMFAPSTTQVVAAAGKIYAGDTSATSIQTAGGAKAAGVIETTSTADGALKTAGKITAKASVPASFADLAAVRTYLASILT